MNAALGFAYLSLATTQTRIARKYHDASEHYVTDYHLKRDIAEWRRLKQDAWRSLRNSSLCDRPRLP